MQKDAPSPLPPPVRYCGVLEDYEQQVDEEPPSPKSPSRVSSPLPLPEQKLSAAYRAELRRQNALINNGPRYRFLRPGEKRRRKKKKKHNKSKHHHTPPPPSPTPRPSPPSPICPYEEYPTFEPDDPVWMRQSTMYAEAALEHYNAAVDVGGGGVKYELVRAIFSGAIFTCKAAYGHVRQLHRQGHWRRQLVRRAALLRRGAQGQETVYPNVPLVPGRRGRPSRRRRRRPAGGPAGDHLAVAEELLLQL
ncbi:hypothetical protein DAI22_06g193900 [Oryza sativa Japonica Group]|nr:hypothetical protein DAI22_06g193900 [Oryza sativa Japonica Group]